MTARVHVFRQLRALRAFERRHLGFLQTLQDHDLVLEIGHGQAARKPLTLKQLLLHGFGSVATIQRRLRRLRRLGVVRQRRCAGDRRAIEILLSPKIQKVFALYADLLRPPAGEIVPYHGDV
jgi:DNA-binding MarR family transcriptional regulator